MHAIAHDPLLAEAVGEHPAVDTDDTLAYILSIRNQYQKNGFGRYAIELKSSGDFIGWAGLKLEGGVNDHDTFIDLGYRMFSEYWGYGYATEASKALVAYGLHIYVS